MGAEGYYKEKTKQTLADQDGMYVVKFSDLLLISHILNLQIESENHYTHM